MFNVPLCQICLAHLNEVIVDGDNILEAVLETSSWHLLGDGMIHGTVESLAVFLTTPICTVVLQVSHTVLIVSDTDDMIISNLVAWPYQQVSKSWKALVVRITCSKKAAVLDAHAYICRCEDKTRGVSVLLFLCSCLCLVCDAVLVSICLTLWSCLWRQ